MMTVALVLLAVGLVSLARGLAQGQALASTRYWARHRHPHRWRVRGTSYMPESDQTLLIEECRRCPVLQARCLAGAWMLNRLGELSPVELASETATLERLWRGHG